MSTLSIESAGLIPESEVESHSGIDAPATLAQVLPMSGVVIEAVVPDAVPAQRPPSWEEPSDDRPARQTREDEPDLIKLYLNDIGQVPLLTKEQEIELAQKREKGVAARAALEEAKTASQKRKLRLEIREGEEAEKQFVRANLRLVVSIAKRYQASGVPLLDLVQEGNIGVMHAVEKFDWRKGFKFSTYATFWIQQSITRGIPEQNRSVRIPAHATEEMRQLNKFRNTFFSEEGRDPTAEELTEMQRDVMGWSYDKVVSLLLSDQPVLLLAHTFGDDQEAQMGDFIADPRSTAELENMPTVLTNQALAERLLTACNLTNQERDVLKWRHGLMDGDKRTLEEVGTIYGVSRERIRQIEGKATYKMKSYIHMHKDDFVQVD